MILLWIRNLKYHVIQALIKPIKRFHVVN